MDRICPICHQRISEWKRATGAVVTIKGKEIHVACIKELSLIEVEEKLK